MLLGRGLRSHVYSMLTASCAQYSYDHSMQKMNEVEDRIPDHKNINSWFGENHKGKYNVLIWLGK